MRILHSERFTIRPVYCENPAGGATLSIVCRLEGTIAGSGPPTQDLATGESSSAPPEERWPELRTEAESVPFKPKADIVLLGSACAPGGSPVKAMGVSLRVGKTQRTLRVLGDRKWRFGSLLALVPTPTESEPFTTMPITYDRAYGGIDEASAAWYPQNPSGRGFIATKTREAVHETPLPNIEDPADLITSWDSKPRLPAGFGFYGRGWQPRVKYLGSWDQAATSHGPEPLPKDFSPAFYNAAHPDLQVDGYLRGDEEIELRGFDPEGNLRFSLPGIRPKVEIARWDVAPMTWMDERTEAGQVVTVDDIPVRVETANAVLDTLVLLPEERIYLEFFRAVVPIATLESNEIAWVRVEG